VQDAHGLASGFTPGRWRQDEAEALSKGLLGQGRAAGEQTPASRIKLEAAGAAPKKPRSGGNKVKLKG